MLDLREAEPASLQNLQIGSSCKGACVLCPSVVACGGMQSAVITRRGELYVWGQPPHADESFGSNATSGNCVPTHVIIQNGIRIVGLCQGSGHMLAISEVDVPPCLSQPEVMPLLKRARGWVSGSAELPLSSGHLALCLQPKSISKPEAQN